MEAKDFIAIFLPDFVSEAFDVVSMQSDDVRIDIFLDEKKITPPHTPIRPLISHGFTPVTTIEDFPVRGKVVFLHLRRRKWLDTTDNTIHARQYDLTHQGTQLTQEFVAFLKATN